MATLADTGSTKVSESNPYRAAMANEAAPTAPLSQQLSSARHDVASDYDATTGALNSGLDATSSFVNNAGSSIWDAWTGQSPPAAVPAELAPASKAYVASLKDNTDNGDAEGPLSQSEINATQVPGDSVKGTPEALSSKALEAQKVKQATANQADILHGKTPPAPTAQQDVNAALAPDQAILNQLPDEYKSTMAQLAPYINSGQDTGNAALNAADANVAKVVGTTDDKVEAGLSQLGKDSKEYAKSVTTQPIIQALLGFGKYEETEGGAQPTGQSEWSTQMDEIYKYLSGNSASSDGLGSPQSAAAATTANENANAAAATSNLSGGGNN
jgi:hypothetical protein